jgi:hypothetical protein
VTGRQQGDVALARDVEAVAGSAAQRAAGPGQRPTAVRAAQAGDEPGQRGEAGLLGDDPRRLTGDGGDGGEGRARRDGGGMTQMLLWGQAARGQAAIHDGTDRRTPIGDELRS